MKCIINSQVFSKFVIYFVLLTIPSCSDILLPDTKLSSSMAAKPKFASGPSTGTGYSFAKGMIHASNEILGTFMKNTETSGSVETATNLVYNNAYMGFVQEDIFRYAKDIYKNQYAINHGTAEKKYLKIASQLKAIMSAYKKNVYLLINTNNVTGVSNIKDLAGKNSLTINLGNVNSDTYISAKTITDTYAFGGTPVFKTDDAATGIGKVVEGTYHAAFLADDSHSSILSGIAANAPVELIAVNMPDGKKYYEEDGTIFQSDYGFQDSTVTNSITVKTVLASCPLFSEKSLEIFLDYVLSHTSEYTSFHPEWSNVSKNMTVKFIMKNNLNCNYRALSYFMDFSPAASSDIEPYFLSAEAMSTPHDMAAELIWLLSHNLDIDLKEKNTTGTWENSYWVLNGGASMALVGDDIFSYLTGFED